jgi:tetratricopeptide (TPR) repeat protein
MVNNLGLIHLALGDGKSALKCFRDSLALDPKYADAYENLGVYYWKRGQPLKARSYFKKCHPLAYVKAREDKAAFEKASAEEGNGDNTALERAMKKSRYRLFRLDTYIQQLAGN